MVLTYNQFLLALVAWREARNQPREAMQGVIAVVSNRAADAENRWPKTISGVITEL